MLHPNCDMLGLLYYYTVCKIIMYLCGVCGATPTKIQCIYTYFIAGKINKQHTDI